jgi:hypothetical protein
VRAYVATTGLVFLLLILAHAARLIVEGTEPLKEPVFVATTIVSAVLVMWAVLVWNRLATAG